MSKTTFLGYVPSLKSKHEAKIVGHKAIQSKGGSIRYTLQGEYQGRKTLPKTVSKADFESVYGFDAKEAEAVIIAGEKDGTSRELAYIEGMTDKQGFTTHVVTAVSPTKEGIEGAIKAGYYSNHAETVVGNPSPASVEPPAPSESPFPQEPSNENFSAERKDLQNYFIEQEINWETADDIRQTIVDLELTESYPSAKRILKDEGSMKVFMDSLNETEVKEAFGFGKDEEEEESEEPKTQEFTVVMQEGDKLELTDITEEEEQEETEADPDDENTEKEEETVEIEEKEAEYEAVQAKVTRPVKEDETEDEEESDEMSTGLKVALGVGALAAGVAIFGAEEYPQEFLDEFYDFDTNPTADTYGEEELAIAYAAWLESKKNEDDYIPYESETDYSRIYEATSGDGYINHDRIDTEEKRMVELRHDDPTTYYNWKSPYDVDESEVDDAVKDELGDEPGEGNYGATVEVRGSKYGENGQKYVDVDVDMDTDYGDSRFMGLAAEEMEDSDYDDYLDELEEDALVLYKDNPSQLFEKAYPIDYQVQMNDYESSLLADIQSGYTENSMMFDEDENLTPYGEKVLKEMFDSLIDETLGIEWLASIHPPSELLKRGDPMAYRVGMSDYEDAFESESDGFTYAYSKGHKDGMKDEVFYRPSIDTDREKNIYKKILKQKAENFSAEPAEKSCVVCEGEIDTEDDIGRYTQCEDCFKPYHNDEDCGFESGIYTCITCLDWIGDNRPKLLKDYEYTHLESYKKKQKAEDFSADTYIDLSPFKQRIANGASAKNVIENYRIHGKEDRKELMDYERRLYETETFEARSRGGKPLLKRQEKLLEQYRQDGGDAFYYDRLPSSLQEELKRIKFHETLHHAVSRWLGANEPKGFSRHGWDAEATGSEPSNENMEAEGSNMKMALGILGVGVGAVALLGGDRIKKIFEKLGL